MKAIIFDMDGLMVDSERLYQQAQEEITRQFNKTLPEKARLTMMGRKPLESMKLLVEALDIPIDAVKLLEMRNDIMREKYKNDLVPLPGLAHIIDTFYGKLKLAISTGAQEEFLDIVVDQLGIRNRFAVLQASDEIEQGKPHPEIYLKTCKKLGFRPGECIVLEDSLNGVLAGKGAGCYVIAVPSEYTKQENFDSADFTADDLFCAAGHINDLLKKMIIFSRGI
jgi:HAD superfamily hydrolase (TIGR01509 family)